MSCGLIHMILVNNEDEIISPKKYIDAITKGITLHLSSPFTFHLIEVLYIYNHNKHVLVKKLVIK